MELGMTYFIQDCEKNLKSMNIHYLNFSPSLHNHHFLILLPKENTFFSENQKKRSTLPEAVTALL